MWAMWNMERGFIAHGGIGNSQNRRRNTARPDRESAPWGQGQGYTGIPAGTLQNLASLCWVVLLRRVSAQLPPQFEIAGFVPELPSLHGAPFIGQAK